MPRRLSLTILAIADQGDDLRFSQKFALRKRLQDRLMKAFADPVGFALMLLSSGCSGLMKPDTHLGENARHIEVSDDQATSCLFR